MMRKWSASGSFLILVTRDNIENEQNNNAGFFKSMKLILAMCFDIVFTGSSAILILIIGYDSNQN